MQFEFEFDRHANISPHIDDLLQAVKKLLEKNLILQTNGSYVIYDLFFCRVDKAHMGLTTLITPP